MDFVINPLTEAECKYTYAQSTQIEGQTGCIGHLRGDFGSGGNEFFTSWFDHRRDLKTDQFKNELDEVINALRSEEYGLLKSRTDMSQYAKSRPDSAFEGSYTTEYLNITRSAYYHWLKHPKSNNELQNETLSIEIQKIHKEHPDMGYRRIRDELDGHKGIHVNDKRVLRICRKYDIKSKIKWKPKSCTRGERNPDHIAKNYLHRDFHADKPNEKWLTDVSELQMRISYNKLQKLMIDNQMKRQDLMRAAEISSSVATKLNKNETVSLDVLMRICKVFHCDIGD